MCLTELPSDNLNISRKTLSVNFPEEEQFFNYFIVSVIKRCKIASILIYARKFYATVEVHPYIVWCA